MTTHHTSNPRTDPPAGALREAIAAADPAKLTREERLALVDLLGRAFDAAGIG